MHNLLQESKRIKAQADKIIKESGIIDILSKYGEVKIAGSYALDVMLRPDLDFYVVAEQHDWGKVLQTHLSILELKYFREVKFVNWIDFKDEHNMVAYYFQTRIKIEDQEWKTDIYLITPKQDRSKELTEHFKELLNQGDVKTKKEKILEIKSAMRQGEKYADGANGRLIYKAVLENNITNPKNFKEFLQTQKK